MFRPRERRPIRCRSRRSRPSSVRPRGRFRSASRAVAPALERTCERDRGVRRHGRGRRQLFRQLRGGESGIAVSSGISDGSGTLSATNASGQAVAGSGTRKASRCQTDYVDVNAILASLHYTAGSGAGADTIQFQAWNQAGVETTASTAVTIDAASFNAAAADASSNMVADFGRRREFVAGDRRRTIRVVVRRVRWRWTTR